MKTQKQIELQEKTHRKRHFKIKTPKTHSNIETKPRLIHSPIAKEIASVKARNRCLWLLVEHLNTANMKPHDVFRFQKVACPRLRRTKIKTRYRWEESAIFKNPLRKNRILFSWLGVWGVFRKQQRGGLVAAGGCPRFSYVG